MIARFVKAAGTTTTTTTKHTNHGQAHLSQAIEWVNLAAVRLSADVEQPAFRADGTATAAAIAGSTSLVACTAAAACVVV
jgi:hypothetical protein